MAAGALPARGQCACASYDSSLGTIPTDQGFLYGGSMPTELLDEGEFHYISGVEPISHYSVPGFVFPLRHVDGLEVEVELRVLSSDFATFPNGAWRAGFALVAGSDSDNRFLSVAIANDIVYMSTDLNNNVCCGLVSAAFNSRDNFHVYRVVSDSDGHKLYIDGQLYLALPLSETINVEGFWWADGSQYVSSDVLIRRWRICNTSASPPSCPVEPDIPTVDPSGINKSRFVSFSVPGAGTRIRTPSASAGRSNPVRQSPALVDTAQFSDPEEPPVAGALSSEGTTAGVPLPDTALRVRLVSLHHVDPPYTGGASVPFTSFEGQVRWVGPPTQYMESSANATPFYSASLQCDPYYHDWSTVGLLHVTGSAIVPSSVYEVEHLAASCMGIEASCTAVSAPLEVITTRWGDVAEAFNPPSTTSQPDLGDISTLVNKFRSTPSAPIKARALLAGDDAFGNFSVSTLTNDFGFGHIAACVDGFRGRAYPYTIQACP